MASHPKKISRLDSRELEAGRNRWIAEFVEQHGSSAHRTAFRLLGNREEAHDAVQESLATALPLKQRTALILRFADERSIAEAMDARTRLL